MRLQRALNRSVSPSPPVRLGLLGGFELVVDGARVDVPASAQRVVAFLALRGRSEPRATVSSELWLDVPVERAAANLRNALWRLHTLRQRVIAEKCSRLGLAAEVSVDVEAVVATARKILTAGHNAPIDLDILSLDLLPHWDEDWVLFERERLRQLRLHAMESLADQLRGSGRFAEAVEAGLSAVAADPLRESAQRALIGAYLAEGNVADARRQFMMYRRLLWADLGVSPSPELTRLVGFDSSL
ncbi:transcriptional regulator, SARP family [Rhodococcus rhodochrous ATCC 21198]|uniref:AfsR/SARP family transcriptional regulator n=1 Tax=Rhodococcus aetherivorans TaxID=191292 RepID=UPI0003E2AFC2|nr:BTAD domain-containing putative transcriptional regulator [Rhodococcus aetherivorans]ETT24122.1 transcriptional regulator, SARP family [Rhodococcus rhodochrous ATCC 21198]NGP28899.1 transcriptional regulator [Rhodococcus aetherivorans]